jgi:hypothetical protein
MIAKTRYSPNHQAGVGRIVPIKDAIRRRVLPSISDWQESSKEPFLSPRAHVNASAMTSSGPKEPIVEGRSSDRQSDDLTGRALRLRIRQQELLAELGVLALQGASFTEMLNHTARVTSEGLGAEYCKVMEYVPAENRLLVRAGVGWGEGALSGMPPSVPIWPRLQDMPCAQASP